MSNKYIKIRKYKSIQNIEANIVLLPLAYASSVSAIKKKQIRNLFTRTSRIKGEKGLFIRGMTNDISVTKEATQLQGRTPACLDKPVLIAHEIDSTGYSLRPLCCRGQLRLCLGFYCCRLHCRHQSYRKDCWLCCCAVLSTVQGAGAVVVAKSTQQLAPDPRFSHKAAQLIDAST